jgi:hypothetical protein
MQQRRPASRVKRTGLGLPAGEGPDACSAQKKRLDYISARPVGCTDNQDLHCFLRVWPLAAPEFDPN